MLLTNEMVTKDTEDCIEFTLVVFEPTSDNFIEEYKGFSIHKREPYGEPDNMIYSVFGWTADAIDPQKAPTYVGHSAHSVDEALDDIRSKIDASMGVSITG